MEIGYGFGLARQIATFERNRCGPDETPNVKHGKGGVYTIKTSIGVSDPLVPLGGIGDGVRLQRGFVRTEANFYK